MIPIKKGATKRCCYGICKTDTRSKSFKKNSCYFISFPKSCLEFRKGLIKSTKKEHIKNCTKCAKCELWVKMCGRSDGRFQSLDQVTKDTYICSLHFVGESGPTEEYPDPIKYNYRKLTNQNLKLRTSLSEKYEQSSVRKLNNSTKDEVQSHEENLQDFLGKPEHDESTEHLIHKESHDMETSMPTICNQETQTSCIKSVSKNIQVNLLRNSAIVRFEKSIRTNIKKCIFYTSLEFDQIIALHNFVSPACEHLEYSGSRRKSDNKTKNSRKLKLTSLQQLLLVLIRLRTGLLEQDLAYRFEISVGLVSQIITTWIQFLYNEFTLHLKPSMFPSRQIISKTLPTSFRSMENIRVLVDCTEFSSQSPSNFEHQDHLYSAHKAHTTYKVLIGCTPNGNVCFVSDVYEGSISDREIFIKSKIADLLEPGDLVLADRDFTVHDIVESKQAFLNIPPFLSEKEHLTEEELKTIEIAKQHIYIKHVMGKIKQFRLLQKVLPQSMHDIMSQTVFVCASLLNFQQPIVIN